MITFIGVTLILFGVVLSGKYWTFEKITLFFCVFNFAYIPAAFWAMRTGTAPAWGEAFKGFYRPSFPSGLTADLLFVIMANIGTTITPWQIFFQQSAVVDKGLDIKDIKYGKIDTFVGSFLTCLVAVFIIIATAAAFYYHQAPHLGGRRPADRRCDRAASALRTRRVGADALCHRTFRRGLPGRPLHIPFHLLGGGRGLRLGPLPQQGRQGRPLVLRGLLLLPRHCRAQSS